MQPALRSSIPDASLAVFPVNGENSHQGFAGANPAPNPVREVCKFTVLLGLQSATLPNRIGSCWTGKERDSESGNDYFGARYYSSNMGRFMSPDWSAQAEPVPYANLDNPQSLNLYSYAGNNPLSRTDADGHFWQELKNFFQYGHWVNNAGLESALAKDAQRDLAQMAKQGVTVNGKPSGQIFNGLTNKQIVDGYNYVEGVLATQKMMADAKAQDAAIFGALTQLPGGSRPSTGRTEPQNLNEQLAMEQAKANPDAGQPINLKGGMKDSNYPGSDGWVKMRQNINGTEVHYVKNMNTGEVADFKFK
jgi:RHS repeat-associated protein